MRIAEADVPRLPALLRAIPPERVRALQAGLSRVRSRFGYGSLAAHELRLSLAEAPPDYLGTLARQSEELGREDALQTLLRVLLFRAAQRKIKRAT